MKSGSLGALLRPILNDSFTHFDRSRIVASQIVNAAVASAGPICFEPWPSNNQRFRLKLHAKFFFNRIHHKICELPNFRASRAFAVD